MPTRYCVFCGSSPGARPEYTTAARDLGVALADRGIELVYGGAHVGLMGVVADAARQAGGHVIGVIPRDLAEFDVAHKELPDLRVVGTMHERKSLMADLSDGFIALPGGLGTFEELFEALTWTQLGLQSKPCGVLNVGGYFDPLIALLDRAVEERFLKPVHRAILQVSKNPDDLLDAIAAAGSPRTQKWMDRDAQVRD